jgi:hypothetical protein
MDEVCRMNHALLIAAAFVAGSHAVGAQGTACYTIQRGDTVAEVAWRLTGKSDNRHQPWFQIIDPAAARIVAKSQYDYVQAGWRACLVTTGASTPVPSVAARAATRRIDLNLVLWTALIAAIALGGRLADQHLQHREALLRAMKAFGERFIAEFERPLIQQGRHERPIQSQLRFRPSRGQLEVRLAPGAGRRYPNLQDHKQNVLYDLGRILQTLSNQPFVAGSLYPHGRWVVVPFQLTVPRTQVGAK